MKMELNFGHFSYFSGNGWNLAKMREIGGI